MAFPLPKNVLLVWFWVRKTKLKAKNLLNLPGYAENEWPGVLAAPSRRLQWHRWRLRWLRAVANN